MDNKQIIKEFKNSFNAYVTGYISGRFGQCKLNGFAKTKELASILAQQYSNLVKRDFLGWQEARLKAIEEILFYTNKIKKTELMFGKQSKNFIEETTHIRIAEFVCDSLPYIED